MLGALERCGQGTVLRNFSTSRPGSSRRFPTQTCSGATPSTWPFSAVLVGDLEIAEDLATAALNFGLETGQEDALIIFGAQLLNIRIRQGRLAELLPLVEDAVASRPRLGVYRAVLAVARVGSRRPRTLSSAARGRVRGRLRRPRRHELDHDELVLGRVGDTQSGTCRRRRHAARTDHALRRSARHDSSIDESCLGPLHRTVAALPRPP